MASVQLETLEAKIRGLPADGQALLDYVARRIVEGDTARDIARRCHLTYEKALQLHSEVFARVYQSIEDTYGADRLKAEKFALKQTLQAEIADCKRAVAISFRDRKPNTRPYGHMNTAIKLLNAMDGHNAPTQSVNTDLRVYAAVQPKDMDRVLSDPRARRAMLEFEQAVNELADAPAPVAIDVTPPWEDLPEGGGS